MGDGTTSSVVFGGATSIIFLILAFAQVNMRESCNAMLMVQLTDGDLSALDNRYEIVQIPFLDPK